MRADRGGDDRRYGSGRGDSGSLERGGACCCGVDLPLLLLLLLLLDKRHLDTRGAAEVFDAIELAHPWRADDRQHVEDIEAHH